MFKKLVPTLLILLSVLLDTAILPELYAGRFLLPLSLILVILTGIQLGRLHGMLAGLLAGLLIDISSGTVGMKLFPYIAIGFLIGFLLDQQPAITRSMLRKERLQLLAVRAIWVSVLLLIHEIVMFIYQYFHTAVFEWINVRDLLLRTLMMTGLCMLLYAPLHRCFFGSAKPRDKKRSSREVKQL